MILETRTLANPMLTIIVTPKGESVHVNMHVCGGVGWVGGGGGGGEGGGGMGAGVGFKCCSVLFCVHRIVYKWCLYIRVLLWCETQSSS